MAAACEQPVNQVRLKLPRDYTPGGLLCVESLDDRRTLFRRVCRDETLEDAALLTLVVDYLAMTAATPCNPSGIGAACSEVTDGGVCRPVRRDCHCVTVDDLEAGEVELGTMCEAVQRPEMPLSELERVLRPLLDAAHGSGDWEPVTTNAPDGAVAVRVTYVAGDDAGLGCGGQPQDPELRDGLMGCVLGCPGSLDDIESAVILDYDTGEPCYTNDVLRCANIRKPEL